MQNRNYSTNSIVEAGLITSIVVILMLMNVYIPIFSLFGEFILPIPITVLFLRHDFKITIISVIVSGIIIAAVYNPISAVSSSVLFGIIGITLGYLIKKNKSTGTILIFLSLAFAAVTIIDFGIYVTLIDKGGVTGFINYTLSQFKDSVSMAKQMYSKMGVSNEQLQLIDQIANMFNKDYIISVIPAVITIISITFSYLNYAVTERVLRRLNYNVKSLKSFVEFHVDAKAGSLIGIALVIGLLLKNNNILYGNSIAVSSQYILQIALLLDGFALAAYYLRSRFKMSKLFTVIIILFTGFSQLSILYVTAGFIDIFFDFRKLNPCKREKN